MININDRIAELERAAEATKAELSTLKERRDWDQRNEKSVALAAWKRVFKGWNDDAKAAMAKVWAEESDRLFEVYKTEKAKREAAKAESDQAAAQRQAEPTTTATSE